MKRGQPPKRSKGVQRAAVPKPMSSSATKRASIFRNGSNQAVRLPQELRFSEQVKEVRIRRLADGLLLSPVKPDWLSFFALEADVPSDFLADRHDLPPQQRKPL